MTFCIQKANSIAAITAQTNGVSIAVETSMTKFLKAFAISALLLAPASIANAQVTFGVRIGEPPPPRYYRVPAQPGPNYEWIEGYWAPVHGHYVWHDGYWARPPYAGAYWVAPSTRVDSISRDVGKATARDVTVGTTTIGIDAPTTTVAR